MVRGAVAIATVTALAGLLAPVTAVAAPEPTGNVSVLDEEALPEATAEEKVLAAAVLGIVAGEDLLILADKNFVFEIWKRAAGKPEVQAAALAAHEAGDEAATAFIRTGIHEAHERDKANELRDATEARLKREAKQRAAATIGITPTPEMLAMSDRDFIHAIWQQATGQRVKEAALAAFGGTAEAQKEFIDSGIRTAHERDQQEAIDRDHEASEAEKAAQAARDAKSRAAGVIGLVAGDDVLVLSDENFVRLIWNRTTDGTEVNSAAENALRSSDPAAWKAFIDAGIYDANKRDIEIALKKKADEDRRLAREIQAKAANSLVHPALAAAAATALAGSDADVDQFLRSGQYAVLSQSLRTTTAGAKGWYVQAASGSAKITPGDPVDAPSVPVTHATWKIVPGLADPACHSLESSAKPGFYLRHNANRVQLSPNDGSTAFKAAATWCAKKGLTGSGVSFEAKSAPGRYLRHLSTELWAANDDAANRYDRACGYAENATWQVDAPNPQVTKRPTGVSSACVKTMPIVKVEAGIFNLDGFVDLLAVDAASGKLYRYPGLAAGGVFGNRVEIGSAGWSGMTELASGRFDGDVFHDIAAVEASTGKLYLYAGTATGTVRRRVEIGTGGWNGMSGLTGGDFNRDGHDDLVASQDSTGKLFLYPGTTDGKLGTRVQIGSGGWNGMSELSAGDFTKDGHDDVVAVENSTGKLWVYPGAAANKLGSRVMIGTAGWDKMNEVTVARFNRDADVDLIAIDKDNKMWMYPGTATPVLGARRQIGSGDW
jgi:hypothetical protein